MVMLPPPGPQSAPSAALGPFAGSSASGAGSPFQSAQATQGAQTQAAAGAQAQGPQGQPPDRRGQLALFFQALTEFADVFNREFPGGEQLVREGMQALSEAALEKFQRIASEEAPGPPTLG